MVRRETEQEPEVGGPAEQRNLRQQTSRSRIDPDACRTRPQESARHGVSTDPGELRFRRHQIDGAEPGAASHHTGTGASSTCSSVDFWIHRQRSGSNQFEMRTVVASRMSASARCKTSAFSGRARCAGVAQIVQDRAPRPSPAVGTRGPQPSMQRR